MSHLWNSPQYNPVAPASNCHSDFQSAISCTHQDVAGLTPATPQKIQDLLTSMRSDLVRIIRRWERSGQVEGGADSEQEEEANNNDDVESVSSMGATSIHTGRSGSPAHMGALAGRRARALETRAAFLNGRPSYLLYYWEVADRHQLLQSSLQQLSDSVGATDGGLTSLSGESNHRQRRARPVGVEQAPSVLDAASLIPLAQSMNKLADFQQNAFLQRERDRSQELRMESRRQKSQLRENSRKRSFDRRAQLMDQGRQYRRLNAELDPRDSRTPGLSAFYLDECRRIEEEIDALPDMAASSAGDDDDSNNSLD